MSGSDNQADNRKYAGEKASSDISGLWKQNFNRLHASRDRKICYGLSKRKTKMKENSNSCEKTLEVIIKNQKTNKDFPEGPVIKNVDFHCRGMGLIPPPNRPPSGGLECSYCITTTPKISWH